MTESERRKQRPLYRGVFKYFPDALEEIAYVSFKSNEKHNPGEPMHWAREKSTDQEDADLRHMLDKARGELVDPDDGLRHSAKHAWRALAALQLEIENDKKRRVKTISGGQRLEHSNAGVNNSDSTVVRKNT